MGFSGTCLTNTDWAYQMANYVPGDGAGFFNTFVKVWMDVTPLNGFIFCIGDRPGSWIVGNQYGTSSQLYDSYQGHTYLRNFFISPTDMEDWGTLGFYTTLLLGICLDHSPSERLAALFWGGYVLTLNPKP